MHYVYFGNFFLWLNWKCLIFSITSSVYDSKLPVETTAKAGRVRAVTQKDTYVRAIRVVTSLKAGNPVFQTPGFQGSLLSLFPSQNWDKWLMTESWDCPQLCSLLLLQPGRWWDPSRNLPALHPAAVLPRDVHNGDAEIHLSAGVSSVSSKRYTHAIGCQKHRETDD